LGTPCLAAIFCPLKINIVKSLNLYFQGNFKEKSKPWDKDLNKEDMMNGAKYPSILIISEL
jgi:hypothetical protein